MADTKAWGGGQRLSGRLPIAPVPLAGAPAARNSPPVGWVTLQADDQPDLTVLCELGALKPWPTDGYGGYVSTDRQGDEALTHWTGYGTLTVPVDLVIDGDGRSVQDIVETIEALAGRGRRRTGGAPPKLIVDAAGVIPHDATVFPEIRWVIPAGGLQWSTDPDLNLTNADGRPTLAACTITLLKSTEGARLQDRQLQAAMRQQRRSSAASKRYTVQAGETLITIARRKLGDPGRWTEIKDRAGQPIRDPAAVKPGAIVRLP